MHRTSTEDQKDTLHSIPRLQHPTSPRCPIAHRGHQSKQGTLHKFGMHRPRPSETKSAFHRRATVRSVTDPREKLARREATAAGLRSLAGVLAGADVDDEGWARFMLYRVCGGWVNVEGTVSGEISCKLQLSKISRSTGGNTRSTSQLPLFLPSPQPIHPPPRRRVWLPCRRGVARSATTNNTPTVQVDIIPTKQGDREAPRRRRLHFDDSLTKVRHFAVGHSESSLWHALRDSVLF